MSLPPDVKLIVAISSRALFDFEEENRVFENEKGDQGYRALQLSRLEAPAKAGVAFPLVKKLLACQDQASAPAPPPLPPGPFKPLLLALHNLQSAGANVPMRIRTALVTARSAPAHERAIRTLMDWNIEIDEAMFLGGIDKGLFLKAFEPDFYFEDQRRHVDSARAHVATG